MPDPLDEACGQSSPLLLSRFIGEDLDDPRLAVRQRDVALLEDLRRRRAADLGVQSPVDLPITSSFGEKMFSRPMSFR